MPRKTRSLLEGPQHHIVLKGHNGEPILSNETDAARLLAALTAAFTAAGAAVSVLAWALLTNHMHIHVAGPIEVISKAMHHALSPYAQRRNARLGRRGRVFVDRFWSSPIHDEAYQVAVFLYTLLNHLKAGMVGSVQELVTHTRCSLVATMGHANEILPCNVAMGLELFGLTPETARRELLEALERGAEKWRQDVRMEDLDAIIQVVCARHGLLPEVVCSGARDYWYVQARREIAKLAWERLDVSAQQIATALGVNRATAWRLIQHAA